MARRPSTKTVIKITVNIKPVKSAEVTPRQHRLVRQFWARLISRAQDEGSNRQ